MAIAKKDQVYWAECLDPKKPVCGNKWKSRAGFGTPNYCPKCRSTRIAVRPL
ncbi:hypothetical protein EC913_104234 [Pseudomonas sp. LP_4_YM]|nr:hypothetical protein EC913_104234 [Pseudomonas sp. LP_4_YM]